MTWEIDDFGELGKTVRLIPTFSGETLQYLKSQDMLQSFIFFVSGKIFLLHMKEMDIYAICRGKCGKAHYMCRVGYEDGKTRCSIYKTAESMVFNDFYKGMPKSAVEEYASKIGTSRFRLYG